ncbi:MAG: hypothetical protein NTW67_05375 [Candidatus Woesearchaeota archaeon]|nr:hypothetical protein [Candidatus Woesearchaeota archaeon]
MEKRIKCTECEGIYIKKDIPYEYLGQRIGIYPALVCNKCGDTMFEGPICIEMEKELKRRKLWGLQTKNKIPIVLSN